MIANYWRTCWPCSSVAPGRSDAMNATLARTLGSPHWASAISFAIGLVALVGFATVAGSRVSTGTLGQMPAWAWLGGLLGAIYVASVTMLGPRLGGMTMVALVIAGQLTVALVSTGSASWGIRRSR
jgi:transporter family-2 protein